MALECSFKVLSETLLNVHYDMAKIKILRKNIRCLLKVKVGYKQNFFFHQTTELLIENKYSQRNWKKDLMKF